MASATDCPRSRKKPRTSREQAGTPPNGARCATRDCPDARARRRPTKARDIRLICALSWYDEHPGWLTELVATLATAGIDQLVALDGPYALYPHHGPRSSPDEYAALITATSEHGIDLTIHTPATAWAGNEVEKRTSLFNLAHAHATPGQDWIVIADADELWTHTTGLRDGLEHTSLDTAELWLYQQDKPELQQPIRKGFRAQPHGIQVQGAHYRYLTEGDTVLWDGSRPATQVEALDLTTVRVMHRPAARAPERQRARTRYYEERLLTRAET